MTTENIEKEIKELVVARLEVLPEDKGVSIGSFGEFTRNDLIEHVQAGDEIGKKIIEVEMTFLRALKEGVLYDKGLVTGD